MRVYSALIAAVFFVAGMVTMKALGPSGAINLIATPAVAATPPGGGTKPVAAMCATGFTANPATYTMSQLSGALGVKYSCSEPWTNGRSPWVAGFQFTCSPKFSHMGKDSGLDAPHVAGGKATYFCISAGPH